MKYDETITEIEEKVLSVKYGKTNIEGVDPFEYSDNLNLFMDELVSKLELASDLEISHNEFFDLSKIPEMTLNMDADQIEELILKKDTFKEAIDNRNFESLLFPSLSDKKLNELGYNVTRVINSLKRILKQKTNSPKEEKLNITMRLSMLKELGFFELEKVASLNIAKKAKLTILITGGGYDLVSRNIRNFSCEEDEIDPKYTAYQYSQESKSLLADLLKN